MNESSIPSDSPSLVQLVPLQSRGDHRGSLVALESGAQVPFPIARVYYIFGTKPGVVRGLHGHKALRQLCIAVAGSCRMVLDDGWRKEEVWLNRPDQGLLIGPGTWREMHDFSADCVLMVLADAPYDEADYLRDYDQFLAFVRR